jgi:hypothetical protein
VVHPTRRWLATNAAFAGLGWLIYSVIHADALFLFVFRMSCTGPLTQCSTTSVVGGCVLSAIGVMALVTGPASALRWLSERLYPEAKMAKDLSESCAHCDDPARHGFEPSTPSRRRSA